MRVVRVVASIAVLSSVGGCLLTTNFDGLTGGDAADAGDGASADALKDVASTDATFTDVNSIDVTPSDAPSSGSDANDASIDVTDAALNDATLDSALADANDSAVDALSLVDASDAAIVDAYVAVCDAGFDAGGDPHNCGSCGHDCHGGACSAGVCQPVVLASGLYYPWYVALSSTNVYWTANDGTVQRTRKDATQSTPTVIYQGISGSSWQIIADATNIYWTQKYGVYSCPFGGCGSSLVQLSDPASTEGVKYLAVDDAYVYWESTASDNSSAHISRRPKDGSGTVETISSSPSDPNGVAVDSTYVYWTENNPGNIWQCPIGGCGDASVKLVTNLTGALDLAIDSNNLYWTSRKENQVWEADKMFGGSTTVASNKTYLGGVLVVGTQLYYAYRGGIDVSDVSSGSASAPTTITTAPSGPQGIAVDDSDIYWADQETGGYSGMILRVAR